LSDGEFGNTLNKTGDWDVVRAVDYTLVPPHFMSYVTGPGRTTGLGRASGPAMVSPPGRPGRRAGTAGCRARSRW
jgi:hypothetical protein